MKFTPLPGEYIASALIRGNELLCREAVKPRDYLIKRITPGMDDLQIPGFLTEHDIFEQTLNENTLYPLIAALGREYSMCLGTPRKGWKICLPCVLADIKLYGTAYIHRRHLPIPVSVCSVHATELFETCPVCSVPIDNHKVGALTVCAQKFEKTKSHLHEPKHVLSIFASDLLNHRGGVLSGYHAEQNIHMKLLVRSQSPNISPRTLNRIIKDNFDLDVYYSLTAMPTTDSNLVFACLGFGTAAEYFHVMADEAATKRFHAEVRSISAKAKPSDYVFPTV